MKMLVLCVVFGSDTKGGPGLGSDQWTASPSHPNRIELDGKVQKHYGFDPENVISVIQGCRKLEKHLWRYRYSLLPIIKF